MLYTLNSLKNYIKSDNVQVDPILIQILYEISDELKRIREQLIQKIEINDIRNDTIEDFVHRMFTYSYKFSTREKTLFNTLFQSILSKINTVKRILSDAKTISPKEYRDIIVYINYIKKNSIHDINQILEGVQKQLAKRHVRLFPIEYFIIRDKFDNMSVPERKQSILNIQRSFVKYKQNIDLLQNNDVFLLLPYHQYTTNQSYYQTYTFKILYTQHLTSLST